MERSDLPILQADATHNTQDYGYYLLTLMVNDHKKGEIKGPGRAIAWGLSSQSDATFAPWTTLSRSVKQVCVERRASPDMGPKVLVTDCTSAAYVGMKVVFSTLILLFWCSWHLTQNWYVFFKLMSTRFETFAITTLILRAVTLPLNQILNIGSTTFIFNSTAGEPACVNNLQISV